MCTLKQNNRGHFRKIKITFTFNKNLQMKLKAKWLSCQQTLVAARCPVHVAKHQSLTENIAPATLLTQTYVPIYKWTRTQSRLLL